MKIHCPEIDWHNQEPVRSLDIKKINDNFYKAITSGSDNRLVVWKVTLPRLDVDSGNDDSASGSSINRKITIEPLADLNKHQNAVNVVKFSPDVNVFASGDDEGNIFVWKLQDKSVKRMAVDDNDTNEDAQKSSSVNCVDELLRNTNEEDWGLWKMLKGHNQSVVDLCWSPNGQFVLSSSVDSDAIVWDVTKGIKLNHLLGHKGNVQGVAWDPANLYLASLSTDRNLRVYNASSKKLVSNVQKSVVKIDGTRIKNSRLFFGSILPTHARRMCFSPGGELLLTPGGLVQTSSNKDNVYTNGVHVFSRNNLNKPLCFLSTGNSFNMAVRCCPRVFETIQNIDNPYPFNYRFVIAVGTQDSIYLFDSQQTMPIAIISNLHYSGVTDLSWSDDGRILMVSTADGCSFIIFDDSELGTPYSSSHSNADSTDMWDFVSENIAPTLTSRQFQSVLSSSSKVNFNCNLPRQSNVNYKRKECTEFNLDELPFKRLSTHMNKKEHKEESNVLIPRLNELNIKIVESDKRSNQLKLNGTQKPFLSFDKIVFEEKIMELDDCEPMLIDDEDLNEISPEIHIKIPTFSEISVQ